MVIAAKAEQEAIKGISTAGWGLYLYLLMYGSLLAIAEINLIWAIKCRNSRNDLFTKSKTAKNRYRKNHLTNCLKCHIVLPRDQISRRYWRTLSEFCSAIHNSEEHRPVTVR